MTNICIVAGARPNFIKVAPIIWAVEKLADQQTTRQADQQAIIQADQQSIIQADQQVTYNLVYTGCRDDKTLEPSLFDDLSIHAPQHFLNANSNSLNEITGHVMGEFEHYLDSHPTDVVIVVDDLASTMAVAIVAKKRGIKLAHLVAGTRSFDISMPKEVNRLVIDGLSDLLFTAGAGASSIVTREGADISNIYMVGNILLDTLRHSMTRMVKPVAIEGMESMRYLVFTLNRKALIADTQWLRQAMTTIMETVAAYDHADAPLQVVAPLRGEARQVIEQMGIKSERLHIISPLSYLEFVWLTSHAMGIITDSGNVAEEATFNDVPCITLNSYTEHIETVTLGTNRLVGSDCELLSKSIREILQGEWRHATLPDRWDGRTAERILQILVRQQS